MTTTRTIRRTVHTPDGLYHYILRTEASIRRVWLAWRVTVGWHFALEGPGGPVTKSGTQRAWSLSQRRTASRRATSKALAAIARAKEEAIAKKYGIIPKSVWGSDDSAPRSLSGSPGRAE